MRISPSAILPLSFFCVVLFFDSGSGSDLKNLDPNPNPNSKQGSTWTTIQRRQSGPRLDFYRTWDEYVNGFGSLDSHGNVNFWLGLERIRNLTKNGDQMLEIDMEDFEGNKAYAKYAIFSVSDASDFYRLTIGGYSGNAGDSMTDIDHSQNNASRFTTKDKDNDGWAEGNCAVSYPGGWWFTSDCGWSYLNGQYRETGEDFPRWMGIHWWSWKGGNYSLARTEMRIHTRV